MNKFAVIKYSNDSAPTVKAFGELKGAQNALHEDYFSEKKKSNYNGSYRLKGYKEAHLWVSENTEIHWYIVEIEL